MNSFESIGEAQIQAVEGSRIIGHAVAAWVKSGLTRLVDAVARHLPEGRTQPW